MALQAKDLMVGDWVRVPALKKYVRVNAVYNTMICPNPHDDEHPVIGDEYLQPIPLTKEILEKNGFVKKEDSKFVCSYHLVVPTTSKENSPIIQINFYKDPIAGVNTLLRCWSPTPPDYEGSNEMHLCNLGSVHELQHALRLCGIEKLLNYDTRTKRSEL